MKSDLVPTEVYDAYWRFAAERQAVYCRRLVDPHGPWTQDPILGSYRFTNAYRAADRVSQYLIREVQYRTDRSQAGNEVFFRTLLFKIFNRIDTWETLEDRLGSLSWQSADFNKISSVLNEEMEAGRRIYSAAYIMPSPALGHHRKHENHLALIQMMMEDGMPSTVERSRSLQEVYDRILDYPSFGPFLAFQYAVDLNYSSMIDFDEGDHVVAGPGALDGISKCFQHTGNLSPEDIIFEMVKRQDEEFARLGLDFPGLFGRRLQPIDCQNLFCEISKYARVSHPNVPGISGRTRIKQSYQSSGHYPQDPFFPPKWKLSPPAVRFDRLNAAKRHCAQLELF